MTSEQKKFYEIKKTRTKEYDVAGEDVQYKIIVDDKNKEIVLQFMESNSKRDWLHNFQWLPYPLKLKRGKKTVWTTKGFACAYRSTFNRFDVSECLVEFSKEVFSKVDYKIAIRGWSFGSAMAKIAVRDFALTYNLRIDELTTFGDVKCWLNPNLRQKSEEWAAVIHEYCCINDFATWGIPLYHRTHKCKVGGKFGLKKIFNTEYNHTHYEEYDYKEFDK